MVRYRGWVPNKTGKLSFSQIGKQSSQELFFHTECKADYGCFFYCVQKRTIKLDDSLFDISTRFGTLLPNKEDIIFVLDAVCKTRVGSSENLTGKIICKFGIVRKTKIFEDVRNANDVFEVNFTLLRNGVCSINAIRIGDDIDYGENEIKDVKEFIASQSYMFLRDMVHRHKHHAKNSDTFLDIKIVNEQCCWKKEIAYNLGKMVIKNPLKNDPESHQSALGILAYLESFLASQSVTDVYSESHLKTMKASLDAEYGKLTFKITGRRWFSGVILGVYYFYGKAFLNWDDLNEWDGRNAAYLIVLGIAILIMMQKTKIIDFRRNKTYLEWMKVVPYYKVRSTIMLMLIFLISGWLSYTAVSNSLTFESFQFNIFQSKT